MENTNNPNNLPLRKKPGVGKNFLPFIIILIVLLIIIGLAYKLMSKPIDQPTAAPSQQTIKHQSPDGWPEMVYSYVGTILEKNKDKIIIQAKPNANYVKADTQLTVLVNETTDFTKVNLPQTGKEIKAGQSGKLFERTKIKMDDLKIGDKVTVIAYENIKNKTEFTAAKIELQPIK